MDAADPDVASGFAKPVLLAREDPPAPLVQRECVRPPAIDGGLRACRQPSRAVRRRTNHPRGTTPGCWKRCSSPAGDALPTRRPPAAGVRCATSRPAPTGTPRDTGSARPAGTASPRTKNWRARRALWDPARRTPPTLPLRWRIARETRAAAPEGARRVGARKAAPGRKTATPRGAGRFESGRSWRRGGPDVTASRESEEAATGRTGRARTRAPSRRVRGTPQASDRARQIPREGRRNRRRRQVRQ